ncbi:MAG: 4-hydroxy-3-methylbut-2-enyl diphosphate reductase, partial [Candidatus Rokuibacteriota bacterium]
VHNRHVVESLRAKGAIFVDELDEVPDDATVIFSAHGISPAVREDAQRRGLRVIDATCPLVTKVHLEAVRYAREGYSIVLIGHEDHDEVIGTLGEAPERIVVIDSAAEVERLEVPNPEKIAYLTQTTLSVDDTRDVIEALRRKFPRIVGPSRDDICYATQNRQAAVKRLAGDVDVLLVIGAANSSNANRLVEVAKMAGKIAYLTQTTLSVDDTRDVIEALRRKFPRIVGPSRDDICYATQNRQAAVKRLAGDVDVLLVIGAANSSNANRLVEVAKMAGTHAYLISDVSDIRAEWLAGASRIGITAGASTPEMLVAQAVDALRGRGVSVREVHVVEEDVRFAIPQELERMAQERGMALPERTAMRQSI